MTRLPVTGPFRVTATYGQKGSHWATHHRGIDLVAEDPRIFCTCYGTVRTVAYDKNGWGYYVSVGDAEDQRHIFCHLQEGSITVKPGEEVTPLTVLGKMGASGNVTGPHLHYQYQDGDIVRDPTLYLGIPNKVGAYRSEDFKNPVFRDAAAIPPWAEEAVNAAVAAGLMLGDAEGTFRPNAPLTRAEMAVILQRLTDKT